MLCPETLVTLANAIAISISEGRSADELTILANVLMLVSDTLATISVQRELLENCKDTARNNNEI